MDIVFKLLIVDDEIKEEDDPVYQKIKKMILDMNLKPQIQLSSGINYKEVVKSEDFDLYLIDYSLVDNIEGPQVIREIRDNNKSLTDIILYSTTNDNLYEIIGKYDLDGVYICKRHDLALKTEKILMKLEKRMLNPLSLRGIVLHNYSEVEFRLKELLLQVYSTLKPTEKEKLIENVDKLIVNGKNDFAERIKKCKDNGDFFQNLFLDKNYLFDMAKKIELLEYLRKHKFIDISIKEVKLLKSLNNERNNLGHSKMFIENNEMVMMDISRTKIIYDKDKCNQIKNKLIKVKDLLDKVEQQNQ